MPLKVKEFTSVSHLRSQKLGGGDCLTKTQDYAKTIKSKYMV